MGLETVLSIITSPKGVSRQDVLLRGYLSTTLDIYYTFLTYFLFQTHVLRSIIIVPNVYFNIYTYVY